MKLMKSTLQGSMVSSPESNQSADCSVYNAYTCTRAAYVYSTFCVTFDTTKLCHDAEVRILKFGLPGKEGMKDGSA